MKTLYYSETNTRVKNLPVQRLRSTPIPGMSIYQVSENYAQQYEEQRCLIPDSVSGRAFRQRVGVVFQAGQEVLLNDACVKTVGGDQ
jgi:hypothetical protein